MKIAFLEKRKKQKYLILTIIILTILMGIWYGFLLKPKPLPKVFKPPEIKINFEVLKNPLLEELQPFEEIKPFEEKIGRENPFISY
ncbi:MAG: hypothetical protein QME61_00655 [Patescibacteria group bacterium]|nr:hypothetical protein [Patescibacteria group bacterium]